MEAVQEQSNLLEVSNLSATINGLAVLRDINFDVPRGACVALVGETGSGKSVTCRTIIGLLDRIGGTVTSGRVRYSGIDLTTIPDRRWRELRGREIALVPQGAFSALDPIMRVGKQVDETIRSLDPQADAGARGDELLEAVQLHDHKVVRKLYPHELSGGMRQRLMIALALAGRPRLLLSDEATTALDVTIQAEILSLLRTLQQQEHMALLFVTHDLTIVESLADYVVITHAGVTVESGSVGEVLARPQHPYTQALLDAKLRGQERVKELPTVAGNPPGMGEVVVGCTFAARCPFVTDGCYTAPPSFVEEFPEHKVACIHPAESRI